MMKNPDFDPIPPDEEEAPPPAPSPAPAPPPPAPPTEVPEEPDNNTGGGGSHPLLRQIQQALGAGGTFARHGTIEALPFQSVNFYRGRFSSIPENVDSTLTRASGTPMTAKGVGEMDDVRRAFRLAQMSGRRL